MARPRLASLCRSMLALALLWGPARAETPAEAMIEPLIVTARLRAENDLAAPVSLSVITAGTLRASGTDTVSGLAARLPAMGYSSPNPRNTALMIRGLGSGVAAISQANDGLEPGVGFYVDGVYRARPAAAAFDLPDLERVEVLRGPQGTLFGKNTTAGVVSLITRAPAAAPEADAEATVGEFGYRRLKASATGPLGDERLTARLSFGGAQRDGMLRNINSGERSNSLGAFNLSARLRIEPEANLTFDFTADVARLQADCCTQVPVRIGTTLRPVARQFPALAAAAGYTPLPLDARSRITDIDAPLGIDTTEGGLSGRVQVRLGEFDLTSLTAWRWWDWDAANDRDYTGLPIQGVQHIPSRQEQASQELRLSNSGAGPLQATVGVFVFNQVIRGRPVSVYGPAATAWLLGPAPAWPADLLDGYGTDGRTRFRSTSAALFGEATWAASDRLSLTAGLRYTWEDKAGAYVSTVAGGGPAPTAILQAAKLSILRPQAYEAKVSGGALSGRIAAVYRVSPGLSAYLSLSRAEKSGGINMSGLPTDAQGQPALATAVIRPEKVDAWEVGLKHRPEGGRAALSLDVFETRVRDFQANVVDAGPGALRGYLANVDRVRSRGLEAEAEVRPVRGLVLTGSATLMDARYLAYANGPCPLERIGTATSVCDLSGRRLPGAARWSWSASADYVLPLAAAGQDAFVRLDANGRSDSPGEATGSRYTAIEGYTLVNLSAGLRSPRGWEASLWVRNVLDTGWLTAVTVQAGNSGLVLGAPGDPRMAGLTLRMGY